MEKIQETTPEKKKSKGKKAPQFGELPELPSDDDDDKYDPSKDACDISDEESLASASDTGGNTPLSSQTKKSLTKNDNNVFKKPQDAATTSGSSVVRSLDFDLVVDKPKDDANDQQGLPYLMRSKANLKDITIEELETKLVPPDITPDMYDRMDENIMFLNLPLTAEEEDEHDPDFMYCDDFAAICNDFDEMKWNKSTKISQKENDQLLEEVFEHYDIDQKATSQQQTTESSKSAALNSSNKNAQNQECPKQPEVQSYWPPFEMNYEERSVVAQQMRQHIQLLSQMALLTSKDNQCE